MTIRCSHCTRTTRSSEAVARLQGWRFFSGVSQTGKQLNDVLCPVHSGRQEEMALIPSWVVHCVNCEWDTDLERELDDPPILTAYEAELAARYHICEPVFEFIRPDSRVFRQNDPDFQAEVNETTPKKK